jgi:cytoskeletal protein CcmA (bactofilin family)
MGATYTRQSSYTDGDVITAAHTNDEFNQLLAAFQASTGHTHDGTANEGGPITKLLGNTITFGAGTAGTDITVTYDGETNDGVMKWMEDEDYFEFSDDILIASTEKLQFRDTAIYINSSTDGQLDLVADTEIQIAATTVDINGAVDISGNLGVGGNLTVTGTTTFNGGTMTLGDAATDNVVFGADVNSSIIPNTDNTYDLGSSGQEWKDIYIDGVAYLDAINFNGTAITATAAEINILDDVTATTAELNYSDTGASVGTVVASKVVTADANKDVASFRNITLTGELDAGSLDISGDADIDGTLEADAITIGGVTLAETISDTVGAMVTSNTETGITVTYDDADNTLDFVIGTLNQDTTGNAATATALETARTIHGVSFDGTANIDLSEVVSDTVGAMFSSNTETGITATYQDADNTIDLVIGAGAVVNSMLADDAVGADELASDAVVTASIVDANVTTAKIADDAVTQAKIADDAVGADQLASDAVVNASIASGASIADSKLATISTAGKVALTALEIDGGTDIGADLTTSDLIVVDDGAGGTNRKAALSRVVTLMSAQGFSTDDPTALAIALG